MFSDVTRDDVFRLEGRRLQLRWPRASDAPTLLAWSRAGDLKALAPALAATDAVAIEGFLLGARADNAAGAGLLLILAQKGAAARPPIGAVALRQGGEPGQVELAIVIAPASRRRGFAAETLAAVLPAVFSLTAAGEVLADLRVADHVARRLFQSCGFVRVDETRVRLGRRAWQQRHVARRIPAMSLQAAGRLLHETSRADA